MNKIKLKCFEDEKKKNLIPLFEVTKKKKR
jgi:hypothetical protein